MKTFKINSFFLLLLFAFCKNPNNNIKKVPKVDNYLEFFYLNSYRLYPFSITCDMIRSDIFKKDRIEVKIEDQVYINKFLKFYNKYKPSIKKTNFDTKIQILIHQGKKIDTLCLGRINDSSINGERMDDLPELLKLIKNKINYK